MTGRSWRHVDFPEDIAQFFVSELHPEQFSPEPSRRPSAACWVTSRDPLSAGRHLARLERLARDAFAAFGAMRWPCCRR